MHLIVLWRSTSISGNPLEFTAMYNPLEQKTCLEGSNGTYYMVLLIFYLHFLGWMLIVLWMVAMGKEQNS